MGLFDEILKPLTDIINGLEKPVEEVEKIFGEVIEITKEIIRNIIDMIKEIENIFNEQTFEDIFIKPLKDVLSDTVNSVEKIFSLIIRFSGIATESSFDLMKIPVEDAYRVLKYGIGKFKEVYTDIINRMESGIEKSFDTSVEITHSLIRDIENETILIEQKIKELFKITYVDSVDIVKDFTSFVETKPVNMFHRVTKVGTDTLHDLSEVLKSAEKRLKNEAMALESMILFLIVMVVVLFLIFIIFTGSSLIFMIAVVVFIIIVIMYW